MVELSWNILGQSLPLHIYFNYELNREYDLDGYNCVQVSMEVLLKGTFYGHYEKQRNIIIKNRKGCVPNRIYNELKKTS